MPLPGSSKLLRCDIIALLMLSNLGSLKGITNQNLLRSKRKLKSLYKIWMLSPPWKVVTSCLQDRFGHQIPGTSKKNKSQWKAPVIYFYQSDRLNGSSWGRLGTWKTVNSDCEVLASCPPLTCWVLDLTFRWVLIYANLINDPNHVREEKDILPLEHFKFVSLSSTENFRHFARADFFV